MNDFQEENINYPLDVLLDAPGLWTIEANTNKFYLPSSSLKGKFRSIMRKLADSSEENTDTDKEIVIVASNGSGKSYFYPWLLVYFEKVTRNFCDDIFLGIV
ncbi:RAMP superfamily CRISPR-associated protein [Chlorogloeopsis fritschii]|uniref:RAMP superfamily CRISPR-associated protein n=1 Tax=Chlorogloeopsis fritschii TaxID=1124 RepID=UPI00035E1E5A|nr:RAMP superfamily CRISPR-associated protein [Chlorogloeopsis fritschii]